MLPGWEWMSILLAAAALALLINPRCRRNDRVLIFCCLALFGSIWIEKGLAMIVAGFIPSPLGRFTSYWPTAPELMISAGIYAIGALLLTALIKIFSDVRSSSLEVENRAGLS